MASCFIYKEGDTGIMDKLCDPVGIQKNSMERVQTRAKDGTRIIESMQDTISREAEM